MRSGRSRSDGCGGGWVGEGGAGGGAYTLIRAPTKSNNGKHGGGVDKGQ